MKGLLAEIPVTAPADVPQDPADPLDMRNPSPEIRAVGEKIPLTEPLGVLPESPTIENLDLGTTDLDKGRAVFLANVAKEDADLRVLATALKLRGYQTKMIATGLGVSVNKIRRVLKQARMDGNLTDILTDLTTEALPLAVEKLIDALEDGQKWAVQDTLRGLGAFRTHTQTDTGQQQPSNTLEVNFIMPAVPQTMNPRGIVGAPREVIDASVSPLRIEEATAVGAYPDRPAEAREGGSGGQGSGDELRQPPDAVPEVTAQ